MDVKRAALSLMCYVSGIESSEDVPVVKKVKTNSANALVKETKITHHSHRKLPGQVQRAPTLIRT